MSEPSFRQVPRVHNISRRAFVADFLAKNLPVVVRDDRDDWPAFRSCTMAYLQQRFGHLSVKLSGDFFNTVGGSTLSDYVDSLAQYERMPAEQFSEYSPPHYLRETPSAERASGDFDQLVFRSLESSWKRRSFMPRNLYFRPFHLFSSQPNRRRYPGFGLFVSPRGALTRFHVDIENDSNLLTQLQGRKRGYLFPPDVGGIDKRNHSFAGRANLNRVLAGEAPDYSPAEPLEFELTAGDSVFLPRGWGHEVFTLSASISLTYNFVHMSEVTWDWLKFWLRGRNLDSEPMKRFVI